MTSRQDVGESIVVDGHGDMSILKPHYFYVYVDWTNDQTSRPFYVGKGVKSRVCRLDRNQKHKHIRILHGIRREILLETSSELAALEIEANLISDLDTYNPNHKDFSDFRANKTQGGEGTRGFRISEHTRALLKYSRRKKYNSTTANDLKKQISDSVKRVWADPDMHAKYVEAALKKPPMSEETKRKLSEIGKGHPVSEETRRKISDALKARAAALRNGQPPPVRPKPVKHKKKKRLDPMEGIPSEYVPYIEEHKQKKIASRKPMSEETRLARSEAMKRLWANPEIKRRRLEARKDSYSSKEFRQKISEISKRMWKTPEIREKMLAGGRKGREMRLARKTSDG